jgi:hypothetical protein
MSARPTKAKSARTPDHHIPIGLQLAALVLDGQDRDGVKLRKMLETADRHAVDLLFDPIVELEHEGPGAALDRLAKKWGAKTAADRIAAVIPDHAVPDPHAWLTDHAVPWQNAGLYLGLCLGFRIAAGLSGKE